MAKDDSGIPNAELHKQLDANREKTYNAIVDGAQKFGLSINGNFQPGGQGAMQIKGAVFDNSKHKVFDSQRSK